MVSSVCCVSVSPVRKEPSHKSEMVSQVQFGEYCVQTGLTFQDWIQIRCGYDGYQGWCQASHFINLEGTGPIEGTEYLTVEWVSKVKLNGTWIYVPMGSSLRGLKKGGLRWNKNEVKYSDKLWCPEKSRITPSAIKKLASKYVNTPYLWGGKTVFGADCSGFTQTLFHFFNIHLLRDAHDQAGQGEMVTSIKHARLGDLAFFGEEETKITHVGLLLKKNVIAHASGKVRIDPIDEKGIMNKETGLRTHTLRLIKRFF
jgi:gamma-D-glutamyl-L-lysine dipeptidyl-peptidase